MLKHKKIFGVSLFLILLIGAGVMLIRPVKVFSHSEVKYIVHVAGIKYPIDAIADSKGGYRFYLDEDRYMWYSYGAIEEIRDEDASEMYIKWEYPWRQPKVNVGG